MQRQKILFVCVENAGRSQIAEGILRNLAPNFEITSAGTKPKSEINPTVIKVMGEIGIDITQQKPKLLSNEMIQESFRIINMGCIDRNSCPSLFVKDVLDWNIIDPKGRSIEDVRQIRDQIKSKVLELIKKIEGN
jgi:arsenate reductase